MSPAASAAPSGVDIISAIAACAGALIARLRGLRRALNAGGCRGVDVFGDVLPCARLQGALQTGNCLLSAALCHQFAHQFICVNHYKIPPRAFRFITNLCAVYAKGDNFPGRRGPKFVKFLTKIFQGAFTSPAFSCIVKRYWSKGAFRMKILVFSDSHGRTLDMYGLIETEAPDAVIHLGDHYEDACDLRRSYPNMPGLCRARQQRF